jgi:RND superfamily putative drug exporter
MGITARIGGASARHPWRALGAWIALMIVATVVGGSVGTHRLTRADDANGDAQRAERILARAGFEKPATEQVLVQTSGAAIRDSVEARRAIDDVIAALRRTGRVGAIRSPLAAGGGPQISRDGRSAVVLAGMTGKSVDASKHVKPLLDAVARVASAHPGLRIEEFGPGSANRALEDTIGKDFSRAELTSVPLTLVILLLAFGALFAALVPVGLGVTAVIAATGLLALASHALPTDSSAGTMVLLIGLAVGVDYSLFYVRRQREERLAGHGTSDALTIAAATSGHAVLVSGLTVIVAMSAMYLTGMGTFIGMAEGTVLVVATAVIGSLTALPAAISLLGDRIDHGRVPFLGRYLERRRAAGTGGVWRAVLRPVLRHPAASAAVSAAVLAALSLPALGLETAVLGTSDVPSSLSIMKTYARIQQAFPGGPQPAQVVVSAPSVRAPAARHAIAALRTRALATGVMHDPVTVDVNPAGDVAVVSIPLAGDGVDAASERALHVLRTRVVPPTVGRIGEVRVTGATAMSVDFNHQLRARTPVVFAFVLGLAFLLMLVSFRSLTIAITAVALNVLSVAAAYGVLVAVFQHGVGRSLIGLDETGPIISWLPLFLFVVLFGLSMDYHVFILSRIRELHDRGASTRDAVTAGIVSSAGVVTSAAIVMVAVFATFATLSEVSLKQLGVGLGVAVLLDATVVRAVLLPATMTLLGERNWWLPRSLRWLDRHGVAHDRRAHGHAAAAHATVASHDAR